MEFLSLLPSLPVNFNHKPLNFYQNLRKQTPKEIKVEKEIPLIRFLKQKKLNQKKRKIEEEGRDRKRLHK
jgi:hypothetical protein